MDLANSVDLSTSSHNSGPQVHTDTEEGSLDEIFRFEDEFPDGSDSFEWEASDDGEDGEDTSGEKQHTDKIHMFKLQKTLAQLDMFYQQKKLNVFQAREELKAFHLDVTQLEEVRDKIEVDIEQEKRAENSVALFRLRAQHKRVCAELQAQEDLGAHLEMVLKEHELELCQVEVELGRFLDLRQELELEEKNIQSQDEKKQKLRLQREKKVIKGRRQKAHRDKIEHDKIAQQQTDVQRRQQEQALAGHLKAAVYLKQTLQRMKQKASEAEEKRKEQLMKRQTAVMALKASYAATQETMNARKQRQKASEQRQREREQQMKEWLEDRGLNSTEHLHRLKLQEERRKRQEEFEERRRLGQMEVVAKLLLERDMKEKFRKSPEPIHEKRRLLQNLLPSFEHTGREERHVKSSHLSSLSDSISDVTSSTDSPEMKWEGSVEMKDEEEDGEMSLAQPEFTGLWEHKHTDYMAPSDENINDGRSHTTVKTNMNKGFVLKAEKKTVKGKESKGPPFISKPEIILFKDWDVGRIYKKKVTLTNVTYATNYCKLLGVSDELRDYVSVSFEPPGPMSAGMACELETIFRPSHLKLRHIRIINVLSITLKSHELDVDLDGGIHFQSATGLFSVPIKCSKKKCEMVVDQCLVDFGTHVVGQTVSRVITMTNRGALGTRYTLTPEYSPHQTAVSDKTGVEMNAANTSEIPSGTENTERTTHNDLSPESPVGSPNEVLMADPASVEPPEISIGQAYEGEVGPFMSVKLPIIFTPTIPGEAKLDFHITFSQPDCEPIEVSVRGVAESVPVWVTKPNIDLKICMYDRLYQDSIEVQSRASTALRMTFKVCKEMRNHMSILPKTGLIQAKSGFSAQLKFLPRRSLYEDAKSFFNEDTGVLEVPLTLQVADQVKPVPFTVHAVVTSSELRFDRSEVDFGCCSIYESVQTAVRLTNCSLLPQEFGFVGIPKFVDVQPNDGFGTLLPSQSMDISLIFSASKAREHNFTLTCKTSINRDFQLYCHATVVQPCLKLSESVLEFGETAVGDRRTAVLCVEDQRSTQAPEATARLFAFSVPESSDFTISPSSGRLLPGQRRLVQVTFSPTLSDDIIKAEALRRRGESQSDTNNGRHMDIECKSRTESPLGLVKDKSKSSKVTNGSSFHSGSPADVQIDSSEYLAAKASLLRCFTERHVHQVIPCFTSSSDTTEEPRHSPHETLYLELHCPAVRPALLLISEGGLNTVHFSQVAVGQKVVKKLVIQNISSQTVKLFSSLLDVNGPFSVLNAMRSIAPEDTHKILIAFTPSLAKKYCETLEVSCSQMTLEVILRGEAVHPLITCSHDGLMNFDWVPENESASQVFQLQNVSSLDVQFSVLLESLRLTQENEWKLSSTAPVGVQNYSGLSVFRVSPSGGVIGPAGAADITVTFHPDHHSLHYRDQLRVQISNRQTVCKLELRGSSCRHNMFVSGGDPVDVCPESLVPSHIYTSGHSPQQQDSKSLLLTLRSEYREGKAIAATHKLHVGCVYSSKTTSKKSLEFIWENLSAVEQQGFRVTPAQGSVEAGHRRPITISWTPPGGLAPSAVVQACAQLSVRGEETELYHVTLMALPQQNTAT